MISKGSTIQWYVLLSLAINFILAAVMVCTILLYYVFLNIIILPGIKQQKTISFISKSICSMFNQTQNRKSIKNTVIQWGWKHILSWGRCFYGKPLRKSTVLKWFFWQFNWFSWHIKWLCWQLNCTANQYFLLLSLSKRK